MGRPHCRWIRRPGIDLARNQDLEPWQRLACALQEGDIAERGDGEHVGASRRQPQSHGAEEIGQREAELIDGLWCAHVTQLRWTVSGEHDQRHARQRRLDDCGMEVRAGRTTRAQNKRRETARDGRAEGGERRGALVVEHLDVELRPAGAPIE